jgi:hypothetical protein
MASAHEKNLFLKWVKLLFALGLSTTTGHSSAFLAVVVIMLIEFFVRIKPIQRLIALGIILGVILTLNMLPEFRDANASWRLLYWKHVMHNVVTMRYT